MGGRLIGCGLEASVVCSEMGARVMGCAEEGSLMVEGICRILWGLGDDNKGCSSEDGRVVRRTNASGREGCRGEIEKVVGGPGQWRLKAIILACGLCVAGIILPVSQYLPAF